MGLAGGWRPIRLTPGMHGRNASRAFARFLRRLATCRHHGAALAFAGLVCASGPAFAQVAPPPAPPSEADLRAEADLLFKRMLVKPNDLDTTFRFSEIETKLGDYEAAIGALERMLFYNPNLPRVKLELGLLYFRLHSFEMARSYFEAAVAAPDTPQDVRDEVAKFLAAIDRGVSDNQFAFYAQFGLRYQTNANAGPNSQVVQALGQNAVLSSQFKRTPDWNAFGISTMHHFYDFNNQRGDGWESDLSLYYARQFKVHTPRSRPHRARYRSAACARQRDRRLDPSLCDRQLRDARRPRLPRDPWGGHLAALPASLQHRARSGRRIPRSRVPQLQGLPECHGPDRASVHRLYDGVGADLPPVRAQLAGAGRLLEGYGEL